MKPKKKKHEHTWIWEESCNECGYREGYCKYCDAIGVRKNWKSRIEVDE